MNGFVTFSIIVFMFDWTVNSYSMASCPPPDCCLIRIYSSVQIVEAYENSASTCSSSLHRLCDTQKSWLLHQSPCCIHYRLLSWFSLFKCYSLDSITYYDCPDNNFPVWICVPIWLHSEVVKTNIQFCKLSDLVVNKIVLNFADLIKLFKDECWWKYIFDHLQVSISHFRATCHCEKPPKH